MQRFGHGKSCTGVRLVVGERFSLELEENPTTGYRWETNRDYDSHLDLVRDSYVADTSHGRLGAGGTREWVYEAAAPGACTLEVALRRAWDHGAAPLAHYRLQVQIHAQGTGAPP